MPFEEKQRVLFSGDGARGLIKGLCELIVNYVHNIVAFSKLYISQLKVIDRNSIVHLSANHFFFFRFFKTVNIADSIAPSIMVQSKLPIVLH